MRTHSRKTKSGLRGAGGKEHVGPNGAAACPCHGGQACQARVERRRLFGLQLCDPYAGVLPDAGCAFVPGASQLLLDNLPVVAFF